MSPTGFLLVLFTAVLTMTANLLLRAGIDAAGGFALGSGTQILHALVRLFMQPRFTLGFTIYFLASVVWFRVVATEPLSLAYPILVSLLLLWLPVAPSSSSVNQSHRASLLALPSSWRES